MSRKEWGWLCPDGHGLLLPKEGWSNLWCPHDDHGGNGRFYRMDEVKEGWWDPSRPVITETTIERQAKAIDAGAEVREIEKQKQIERERERAMAKAATKTTAPKAVKEPKACLCGCGGMTKGGRFIPGHDARFHARVKTLMGQFGVEHEQAEKIASKGPLTGKYAAKPAKPKAEAPAAEVAPTEEVEAPADIAV